LALWQSATLGVFAVEARVDGDAAGAPLGDIGTADSPALACLLKKDMIRGCAGGAATVFTMVAGTGTARTPQGFGKSHRDTVCFTECLFISPDLDKVPDTRGPPKEEVVFLFKLFQK